MKRKRKKHNITGAKLIRDKPILSLSDDEEEEYKLCMEDSLDNHAELKKDQILEIKDESS